MKKYKTYILAKANICPVLDKDLEQIANSTNYAPAKDLESQKDLMKIVSILVSTGVNKNDDVFLKDELVPVRKTGAHKPLNLDHNEKEIIGHMVKTYITTKSGNILDDKKIEKNPAIIPKDFDITNEAVIYQFLFPQVAQDIKHKASQNKLFVSVEMWFSDYDYLVGSKIVKRDQATSSALDPLLRINGGPGQIKSQKIGRVLRNLIIGGIGVVSNPANPESVIKSVSDVKITNIEDLDSVFVNNIIGDISSQVEEKSMNKNITEEMKVINWRKGS
jgi:hypothetical protein